MLTAFSDKNICKNCKNVSCDPDHLPALLKLQPKALYKCDYYNFFYPGTQLPGNKKNYAMQYKKYKNQAGMNLTPPPPSQNCHVVR